MTDLEIIENFLQKIKQQIEQKLPSASGGTARSLEVVMDSRGGKLMASPYIASVEYGRGPRKTTQDQGMIFEIQSWLAAKGMDASLHNARSVTWMINKYGTRQYQSGTGSGVLTSVINEGTFNSLTNQLAESQAISITSEVLSGFKLAKIR